MSERSLNRRFLLLQGLLALIECIGVSYVSPILFRLGYSAGGIGLIMTLAALASTLFRPLWGFFNDRFACARQITVGATAVALGCFFLLTHAGGQPVLTAIAVMGLNVTAVCMMNFADSWALRLISEGSPLNYGVTRAGGSFSFAIGAVVFGIVISHYGFQPGNQILAFLFVPLAAVALSLPNPRLSARRSAITVRQGVRCLTGNSTYLLMLSAFFLCTGAICALDSFYSIQILALGGSEREVGLALFVQAMSEVPVMAGYVRIRKKLRLSAAGLLAVSMLFFGVKALLLGMATTCGAAVATALLQMLSYAIFAPACVEFMLQTIPAEYLATAHLVFIGIGQGAASVLGNSLDGMLADRFGIGAMFRMVSLLAFVASVLAAYTAYRQKERRSV